MWALLNTCSSSRNRNMRCLRSSCNELGRPYFWSTRWTSTQTVGSTQQEILWCKSALEAREKVFPAPQYLPCKCQCGILRHELVISDVFLFFAGRGTPSLVAPCLCLMREWCNSGETWPRPCKESTKHDDLLWTSCLCAEFPFQPFRLPNREDFWR